MVSLLPLNNRIVTMKEPLFDSQGNIEPWGRDFWTENILSELLIVIGIPALLVVLTIFLVAKFIF